MSKALDRAMAMMAAARPASGFRPETEEEWDRLIRALTEWAAATYMEMGMPEPQARALALLVHSGKAGRRLAEAAFTEDRHE